MKNLMTIAILSSILSFSAFANNSGETTTDCPWADQSGRSSTNAKAAKEAKKPDQSKGAKGTRI